ncbi:hypothetical protein V5799_032737 [Amblyomma americanum]|uniref:Uncharacterized protein n=1 Tax=Amblyomma americanum TaxID=6943 RepID=A0AAQ4DQB4_AMBAM
MYSYSSGSARFAQARPWDDLSLSLVCCRLSSTVSVRVAGELVLREAVDMAAVTDLSLEQSMGGYDVTGIIVLLGPSLEQLAGNVCAQLESREQYGVEPGRSFVAACSALRSEQGKLTGCVVRILSTSSQEAYSKLEELLQPLFPVIGGNPFSLKY